MICVAYRSQIAGWEPDDLNDLTKCLTGLDLYCTDPARHIIQTEDMYYSEYDLYALLLL